MAPDETMDMNGNKFKNSAFSSIIWLNFLHILVYCQPRPAAMAAFFLFCSGNDGCDLFLTVLTDPKHYLPKCRWILADAAKRGNRVCRVLLVFVKTASAHVKLDWGIIGSSCERDLFFSGNLPGACR